MTKKTGARTRYEFKQREKTAEILDAWNKIQHTGSLTDKARVISGMVGLNDKTVLKILTEEGCGSRASFFHPFPKIPDNIPWPDLSSQTLKFKSDYD